MESLTEEQKQQLDELNYIKKTTEQKIEYLRRLNDVAQSNKEVQDIIQSIESQKDILSEEDKIALLKAFKQEKASLVKKSAEIKKSLNMDELLEAFKDRGQKK